jgi:hypothetical protein
MAELKRIAVREAEYYALVRLKGFISLRDGYNASIADVVEEMVEQYDPEPLDLEGDDLFHYKRNPGKHEKVPPHGKKEVRAVREEGQGQEPEVSL